MVKCKVLSLIGGRLSSVGGSLQVVQEGIVDHGKIAYFDKDDVFAHGVRILNADLGMFVKVGDVLKCQVSLAVRRRVIHICTGETFCTTST